MALRTWSPCTTENSLGEEMPLLDWGVFSASKIEVNVQGPTVEAKSPSLP